MTRSFRTLLIVSSVAGTYTATLTVSIVSGP